MNERKSVFVTRLIASGALEKLRSAADVEVWQQEEPPPPRLLLERVSQVDGLLTLLTDPIDAGLIAAAGPNLKVISQMAVGFDNIDVEAATRRGIPVGHTPGVLTETTADFAWALLMAAARRVNEADREVRRGIWKPWGPDVLTGPDVYGATLGIVGFGRIGQAMARRAAGFKMDVLYCDPKRVTALEEQLGATCVEMDELLARSDFVSLHTYLSPETYHLFDRDRLAHMKPSAVLINTSRGPVVDPDALYWALSEKKIAAAALDVFEPEPIPPAHPLLQLENVIITPHIASASIQTRRRMAQIAAENLLAGLRGERLPYCANPQVYK